MSDRVTLDQYIETLQILAREGGTDRTAAERERDAAHRAKLIDNLAHELAEFQRVEARSPGLVLQVSRPEDPRAVAMALADHLTDLIDPHVRPARPNEEQTA